MHRSIGYTTVWVVAAVVLLSCGTEKPRQRGDSLAVAQFAMSANDSEALQLDDSGDCEIRNLPNPLGCVKVEGWVTQSGEARGTCETADGMRLPIRRFADMGLFDCVVNPEGTGAECLDAFLNNAFTVDREGCREQMQQKAMERLAARSENSEAIETPTGAPVAEAQPIAEAHVCEAEDARQAFADRLNALLAAAGLDLVYEVSDQSNGTDGVGINILKQIQERFGGSVWGIPALQEIGLRNAWCEQDELAAKQAEQHDEFINLDRTNQGDWLQAAKERLRRFSGEDDAYCEGLGNDDFVEQPMVACSCARMTTAIMEQLTCEVPHGCSPGLWHMALQFETSMGNRWLNRQASRTLGGRQAGGPNLICQGSPLVLDLNDDGLELTSLRQGVTFDLSGRDPVKTAWISGTDDVLLAIDRNGNGRIDGGTELFGEAETLLGITAPNGFAALSVLDDPALGGNGDGMVDANDARFTKLLLWGDANRDGASQSGELRSLADAGVAALPLQCISRGSEIDAHGNDLRLRGSFVRADGSHGALTDVYFVTGWH